MVLHYEELVREPTDAVQRVVVALAAQLQPLADARIPSFGELRQADDRFFRRGLTDTHRDELPEELHELFWSQPDNVTAMALLGYGAAVHDPYPGERLGLPPAVHLCSGAGMRAATVGATDPHSNSDRVPTQWLRAARGYSPSCAAV